MIYTLLKVFFYIYLFSAPKSNSHLGNEILSFEKYEHLSCKCTSARDFYNDENYLEAKDLLKECAFLIETAHYNYLLLAKSYFCLNQTDSGIINLTKYFQSGGKIPNDLPIAIDMAYVDSLFKKHRAIYEQRINLKLSKELSLMLEKDQLWRTSENFKIDASIKLVQDSIDYLNQKRLTEIVSLQGWPCIYILGNKYSSAASTIAMHSDLDLSLYFIKESVNAARLNKGLWSSPSNINLIRSIKSLKKHKKIQFHFVELDENNKLKGDWKWEIKTVSRAIFLKQQNTKREYKLSFMKDLGLGKEDRIIILDQIKSEILKTTRDSVPIKLDYNINGIKQNAENNSFIVLELL